MRGENLLCPLSPRRCASDTCRPGEWLVAGASNEPTTYAPGIFPPPISYLSRAVPWHTTSFLSPPTCLFSSAAAPGTRHSHKPRLTPAETTVYSPSTGD